MSEPDEVKMTAALNIEPQEVLIHDEELWDWAVLDIRSTGLRAPIMIREWDDDLANQPVTRVRNVIQNHMNPGSSFSLKIDQPGEVFEGLPAIPQADYDAIIKWIEVNQKALLDLWDGKIDQMDAMSLICDR